MFPPPFGERIRSTRRRKSTVSRPNRAPAPPGSTTASKIAWACIVVGLAIGVIAVSKAAGLVTLADLTRAATANASTTLVTTIALAALVGIFVHGPAPDDEASSSAKSTGARTTVLWAAGAGAAVLTALLGLKIVNARFGHEPSVLFVGSGTVDRFLFTGSTPSISQFPDPFRVSTSVVWPWSLESTSGAGLNVLTASYVHHSDEERERSVPVIAMTSSRIFESRNGELALCRCLPPSILENAKEDAPTLFLPIRIGEEVDVILYGIGNGDSDLREVNVECRDDGLMLHPTPLGLPIEWRQTRAVVAVGTRGSATGELCGTQATPRDAAPMQPHVLGVERRIDWALDYQNLEDVKLNGQAIDPAETLLIAVGSEARGLRSIPHERYLTGHLVDSSGAPVLRDYALAITTTKGSTQRHPIDPNRCVALYVVWSSLERPLHDAWRERLRFDFSGDEVACTYVDRASASWLFAPELLERSTPTARSPEPCVCGEQR